MIIEEATLSNGCHNTPLPRLRGEGRREGFGRVWLVAFGCALAIGAGSHARAAGAGQASPTPGIDALAWLTGAWSGTMGKAAIEEHWIAPKGGTMLAVARTTAGDRTVMFEFLRIEARADGLYYVAQPGGRPPVAFKLTDATARAATFENPQHDHPKIIRYRRDGESLVAEIEGDEKGRHVRQAFTYQLVR